MKGTGISIEKMMSRQFRKVDNVVWDLMSGHLGIRTKDGEIATIDGEGDDATISLNPFEDFGVQLPAYAQATPVDAVKIGDLIYTGSDSSGWVIEIKNVGAVKAKAGTPAKEGQTTFRIMRPSGSITSWKAPKIQVFGLDSGVLVVRSLMSMLPGGSDGLAGLQGMMLPMLMLGGDGIDLDKMMPLILMGQMGGMGGSSGSNPMGGFMQMMMMSKMMGGDGGLGGLFGGNSKTTTPFRS